MIPISGTDTYKLQQAIAEAQRYVTTSNIPTDVNHYEWRASIRVTRRGQTVDATWCDGEYFVQIIVDTTNTPLVSVAELNWIHNNSDEQCDCDFRVEESNDPASSSNPDVVRDYFNKVVQEALKDIQLADSTQHLGENTLGVYEYPG